MVQGGLDAERGDPGAFGHIPDTSQRGLCDRVSTAFWRPSCGFGVSIRPGGAATQTPILSRIAYHVIASTKSGERSALPPGKRGAGTRDSVSKPSA